MLERQLVAVDQRAKASGDGVVDGDDVAPHAIGALDTRAQGGMTDIDLDLIGLRAPPVEPVARP